MKVARVERVSPENWKGIAQKAHALCFGKTIDPETFERLDYALLVIGVDEKPMGYATCLEVSSEVLHWGFGGAFPGTRSTAASWEAYLALIAWVGERYAAVTTAIESDNVVMLKMAMKAGYRIVGTHTCVDKIFVQMALRFPEKKA